MLLVVALIAAEVGIRARRGGHAAREARSDLDRLYRVIELAARGGDIEDVVSSARAELIGLFGLARLRVRNRRRGRRRSPASGSTARSKARRSSRRTPTSCSRRAASSSRSSGRGIEFGRLVLFASESVRASLQKRLVAVAIADELGITLATNVRYG